MYFVYVLKNVKTKELYYGYTNNLERRTYQHNLNYKSKLIYYEAYLSESDARRRERRLKNYGQSITYLKTRIEDSLAM
jgi:putative endonuclease